MGGFSIENVDRNRKLDSDLNSKRAVTTI